MRWTRCALLSLIVVALGLALTGQESAIPRLTSVDPANGKAGDLLTVSGSNLSKEAIAELYLTDGKTDMKTDIMEQAAESIKFKIPSAVKAGRYSLMVLTKGDNARLIEQPVKVTVE